MVAAAGELGTVEATAAGDDHAAPAAFQHAGLEQWRREVERSAEAEVDAGEHGDAEHLAVARLQADALVTIDEALAAKAAGLVPLAPLDALYTTG